MTEYHAAPGWLFHEGKRFICPCGCKDFKVEVGTDPPRFWCDCGAHYTEYLASTMAMEHEEVSSGD